jgi:hypothetical protein
MGPFIWNVSIVVFTGGPVMPTAVSVLNCPVHEGNHPDNEIKARIQIVRIRDFTIITLKSMDG